MPKFKPRTGREHIEAAAQSKGGGFRGFVPEIKWREDGEKKYVLILTPIDEVATLALHEWIPVGTGEKANGESYTRYKAFLSRKDPLIGEDYDEISDRLGREAKERCYGVAVELEPVMETVRGRNRPKGFVVKTDTYTRNTDDGEQEVTQPIIGLVIQSSALVWTPLTSLDDSQGPLDCLPIEVTRRKTDRNTRYDFVPFVDAPVDLSPVTQFVNGISCLNEEMEEIEAAIAAAEDDDLKGAQAVAQGLYDHYLGELADKERYDELVGPLTEIPEKYGKKKESPSRARPARRTARAAAAEAEPEAAPQEPSKAEQFAALKARLEA